MLLIAYMRVLSLNSLILLSTPPSLTPHLPYHPTFFPPIHVVFSPTSLLLLLPSLLSPADVTETFGRRLMDTLLLRNLAISLPIGTATATGAGGGGGGGGPLLGAWGRTDSSMSDATDAQTVRRKGGERRGEDGRNEVYAIDTTAFP